MANHTTGAQRHNKRQDEIWERSIKIKEEHAANFPSTPFLSDSDNDLVFEAVGIARTEIDKLWQNKGHLMSMKMRQELIEKASRLNDLHKKLQDC